jgi:hypothetical protein
MPDGNLTVLLNLHAEKNMTKIGFKFFLMLIKIYTFRVSTWGTGSRAIFAAMRPRRRATLPRTSGPSTGARARKGKKASEEAR